MAVIFKTAYFLVHSAEPPLVDRGDGGHITIDPRFKVSTRQQLSPVQSIELMRLISVVGEAMTIVMTRRGIEIGRINYQDNGNWSVFKPGGPQLHYHIYGRAKNAVRQKYGESLYFPLKDEHPEFYKDLQPLTQTDVDAISEEIDNLFKMEKYADAAWFRVKD